MRTMKKRICALLIGILLILGGLPVGASVKETTIYGDGTVNPFFKGYLKALSNASGEDTNALLTLLETVLNGTLTVK
ncbi:hypothetical protein [Thermococcus sp.]